MIAAELPSTITTLAELAAALRAEGYHRGTPSAAIAEIDGEACGEAICGACGRAGLELHPWVRDDSYRAFAVCPRCGSPEEF